MFESILLEKQQEKKRILDALNRTDKDISSVENVRERTQDLTIVIKDFINSIELISLKNAARDEFIAALQVQVPEESSNEFPSIEVNDSNESSTEAIEVLDESPKVIEVVTEYNDSNESSTEVIGVHQESPKKMRKTAKAFERKCAEWESLLSSQNKLDIVDQIKAEIREWKFPLPETIINLLDAADDAADAADAEEEIPADVANSVDIEEEIPADDSADADADIEEEILTDVADADVEIEEEIPADVADAADIEADFLVRILSPNISETGLGDVWEEIEKYYKGDVPESLEAANKIAWGNLYPLQALVDENGVYQGDIPADVTDSADAEEEIPTDVADAAEIEEDFLVRILSSNISETGLRDIWEEIEKKYDGDVPESLVAAHERAADYIEYCDYWDTLVDENGIYQGDIPEDEHLDSNIQQQQQQVEKEIQPTPTKSRFGGKKIKNTSVVAVDSTTSPDMGSMGTQIVDEIQIKVHGGNPKTITKYSEQYIIKPGTYLYEPVTERVYQVCNWDVAELMNPAIVRDYSKIPVMYLFDDSLYLVLDMQDIEEITEEFANQKLAEYTANLNTLSSGSVF